MEILYNQRRQRIDHYTFELNQGGELGLRLSMQDVQPDRCCKITFMNGKFHVVEFPFKGLYTRSHWYYLKAIAEKIEELEKEYLVK